MTTTATPDRWQRGDAYERYMGRWSRLLAPRFVQALAVAVAPSRRWLDVGCGTGALAQAILDHGAPSALIGVDPSAGFLDAAKPRRRACRRRSCCIEPAPTRCRWPMAQSMPRCRRWC